MSESEDSPFNEAMAGVKPLATAKRVKNRHQVDNSPGVFRRREAAQDATEHEQNALSGGGNGYVDGVEQVEPSAELSYRCSGIQNTVFKKLRLGRYTVDARLDLHNNTVDQARSLVYQFIRDCRDNDIRCALITHGKGEGREIPALLKSCVAHWLPQMDEVLAFHSATLHHGGKGATYVLLRKASKTVDNTL